MNSLLFFLVTLLAMAFTRVCLASLSVETCDAVFSAALENSSRSTEVYLSLFRALAKNRNALTLEDFTLITSQGEGVNPFQIIKPALSSEDRFAFEKAFEGLLKNQRANPLDWARIKAELEVMAQEKQVAEIDRGRARDKTKAIFVPILKHEFEDSLDEGWIEDSFKLQDGTLMAILKDGAEVYLYNVAQRTKIINLGLMLDLGQDYKYVHGKSGKTLFATRPALNRLTIYEITQDHQIRTVKEGFQAEYPSNPTEDLTVDLGELYLTESPSGRPAVLEVLSKPASQQIVGYLEVEVETGNKRYFPARELESTHFKVAENGHLISYTLESNHKIVVRDVSADNVIINTILLPSVYVSILDIESFSADGSDKILFYGRATGGKKQIYFDSGKAFDVGDHLDKLHPAVILTKKDDGYQKIKADSVSESVAIFDEANKEMAVFPLKVEHSFKESRLLKLRNGKSILFVGRGQRSSSDTFLFWLPLEDNGALSKMSIPGEDIKKFWDVYETSDGRIEALFETDGGYKIFQVFGPLEKAGAI